MIGRFKNHPHNDKPELASAQTLCPSVPTPAGPPASGCAHNYLRGLVDSFSDPTPVLQHRNQWGGGGRVFKICTFKKLRGNPKVWVGWRTSTWAILLLSLLPPELVTSKARANGLPSRTFNGITFKGNEMKSKFLSRTVQALRNLPELLFCPLPPTRLTLSHHGSPNTLHPSSTCP